MDIQAYNRVVKEIQSAGAQLVAVSKTKPVEDIKVLYEAGQRVFGENKVQEMVEKYEQLPADIQWHMIGHLQRNKVKYIAPFVSLIHGVDSERLYREIEKQAAKVERTIEVLLQMHIAEEETKFGLSVQELKQLLEQNLPAKGMVRIVGLMGMATNTDNEKQVAKEFEGLHQLFLEIKEQYFKNAPGFRHLSMGMSGDYQIAIQHGSTLVRIGSLIFGERNYSHG